MAKICGVINPGFKPDRIIKGMARPLSYHCRYREESVSGDTFGFTRLYLPGEGKNLYENQKEGAIALFSGYLLEPNYSFPARDLYHQYKKNGPRFIKDLNGVFNFVVYQKEAGALTLFNDRYGVMPLYYYLDGDTFVFASEVKAVVQNSFIPKDTDWQAWSEYYSFRYLFGDRTFFKQVKILPPAAITYIKKATMTIKPYWDFSKIKIDYQKSSDEWLKEGEKRISTAVKLAAGKSTEAICFLSGGYDSRCLAAFLKNNTSLNLTTLTTCHPTGKADPVYAKTVAKTLRLKNTFVPHPGNLYQKYFLEKLYRLDCLAVEHIWALPLANSIKQSTLVFDGLAGDLFLKGLFQTPSNLRLAKDLKKLTPILVQQNGYDLTFVKKFFKQPIKSRLKFARRSLVKELESAPDTENRISAFFARNRTKNALSLCSQNIFSALEKRFPFLENKLVEFSLSIPPQTKLADHIYEKIIKETFPDIAALPSTNDATLKKKAHKIFWGTLTKLKIQKSLKTYFKNLLFAREFTEADQSYLLGLVGKLEIPEYVDRDYLSKFLAKKKINFAFYSFLEHLVWYNLFVSNKLKLNTN